MLPTEKQVTQGSRACETLLQARRDSPTALVTWILREAYISEALGTLQRWCMQLSTRLADTSSNKQLPPLVSKSSLQARAPPAQPWRQEKMEHCFFSFVPLPQLHYSPPRPPVATQDTPQRTGNPSKRQTTPRPELAKEQRMNSGGFASRAAEQIKKESWQSSGKWAETNGFLIRCYHHSSLPCSLNTPSLHQRAACTEAAPMWTIYLSSETSLMETWALALQMPLSTTSF